MDMKGSMAMSYVTLFLEKPAVHHADRSPLSQHQAFTAVDTIKKISIPETERRQAVHTKTSRGTDTNTLA